MQTVTYINEYQETHKAPTNCLDMLETFNYAKASDGVYVPKCDLKFYEMGVWPIIKNKTKVTKTTCRSTG